MHGIFGRTIHGDPDPELKILLKFVEVVVKDVCPRPPNELSPVDKNKYVSTVSKMINPTNQKISKILLAWNSNSKA